VPTWWRPPDDRGRAAGRVRPARGRDPGRRPDPRQDQPRFHTARITDAVGGVEFCLDQGFTSAHNGKRYRSGCQQLKGSDVVPVLRARRESAGGAHERDRNGQRYLAALAGKLASARVLTDPKALNSMLNLVGKNGLTVDGSVPDLVAVAGRMRTATVVGISGPSAADGIDPKVGRGLFAATRADDLGEWVEANPAYVVKR
jgi:hypothetical protein